MMTTSSLVSILSLTQFNVIKHLDINYFLFESLIEFTFVLIKNHASCGFETIKEEILIVKTFSFHVLIFLGNLKTRKS